ncbi:MAG: metallophosphoesterase family protein [Candidatus Verstraetearchaeota archaeon]|nr:metallophosphoesterase family protein [Candidatus Verstraetearchaeota archaeon]
MEWLFTMRLLAISDIHGKVSSLNSILERTSDHVDAITVSGDISHYGDRDEVQRILGILEGTGVPVYYVLGNCDPKEALGLRPSKAVHLEDRCEEYQGLALTGAGGSMPTPFGTTFERDEEELLSQIVKNLRDCRHEARRLMLVVHNPPYGGIVDRTSFGRHVGSKRLKELILTLSPVAVQCGHIHEAAGVERIGETVVFNPGPAMKGNHALVEVAGDGVRVSLEKV